MVIGMTAGVNVEYLPAWNFMGAGRVGGVDLELRQKRSNKTCLLPK